jgi:hypothetical protein
MPVFCGKQRSYDEKSKRTVSLKALIFTLVLLYPSQKA